MINWIVYYKKANCLNTKWVKKIITQFAPYIGSLQCIHAVENNAIELKMPFFDFNSFGMNNEKREHFNNNVKAVVPSFSQLVDLVVLINHLTELHIYTLISIAFFRFFFLLCLFDFFVTIFIE